MNMWKEWKAVESNSVQKSKPVCMNRATFVSSWSDGLALTCYFYTEVSEQLVAVPAGVDPGILVRHVDDAQHPLPYPRAVARRQSRAILEPYDWLCHALGGAGNVQSVANPKDEILQEGRLAGHGVWEKKWGGNPGHTL